MGTNQNNQTAGAADSGEQVGQGGGVPADVSAAASALGKRAKGKPKKVTPERREQLVQQAEAMNAKRRSVTQGRVVSVGAAGSAATVRQAPRVVQTGRVVQSGRVVQRGRIVAASPGDVRRFGSARS